MQRVLLLPDLSWCIFMCLLYLLSKSTGWCCSRFSRFAYELHCTTCKSKSGKLRCGVNLHQEYVQILYSVLWRPCNFTLIHSLTGPVGQLFASRLGGSVVRVPGMHPHSQWNWVLLLAQSHYIGDWSLASPEALHRQWEASLGLMPSVRKATYDHTLTSPVPFYSLQVFVLLATQWPVRASVKFQWGSPVEPLQYHSHTQSHWSSRSTVCFPPRGQ